jgi:hypothetical protein
MHRILIISDAKLPTASIGKPQPVWIDSLVVLFLGVSYATQEKDIQNPYTANANAMFY